MSIQSLSNAPGAAKRRAASSPARTAGGTAFQDQLVRTGAAGETAAHPAPDHAAFVREDLLADLDRARLLALQRNREGREWKKEQEEWDRLMKGLDSWIDALRARSERERKEGGSGGVTAEGGEALMALYRGYIAAAVQAEGAGEDGAVSREDLLAALTSAQSALLERLKEDQADEEEREEWTDLLRRLDRWIASLREDGDLREEAVRRVEDSAVEQKAEYEA